MKDVDGRPLTIPVDDLSFAQKIVIEKIAEGLTQRTAAGFAGVHETTISDWKKRPNFAKALRSALAVKTGNRFRVIEDSLDWRAKAWQLERDPDSRRDYGQANIGLVGGRNTINVLAGVDVGFSLGVNGPSGSNVIDVAADELPDITDS